MNRLLLATTNDIKVQEISDFLSTLPFTLTTLRDFPNAPTSLEEKETLEEIAIDKAMTVGNATGVLTLADDTGVFLKAKGGWPGVRFADLASTQEEKVDIILSALEDVPSEKRTALFRTALALCDPKEKTIFVAQGERATQVVDRKTYEKKKGTYTDPLYALFSLSDLEKTYDELTILERNNTSHRGIALQKMKYHLQNTYSGRHIVVPIAFILQEGKIYMQRRNDPFRPEFHGRYEFPGGSVEYGESVEESLVREVREETGFEVEIVEALPKVFTKSFEGESFKYQLYLLPFACRIVGGSGEASDSEVLDHDWFSPEEVLDLYLFDGDAERVKLLLPYLQKSLANS